MFKKSVIVAVAMAMGGGAQAAEANKFTKEEKVGGLTGAAAGAIVGGPVGAAVGFMIGGIWGDNVGATKRVKTQVAQLEQELIDTRIELARASERQGGDEMLDELARRLHADVMFRTGGAELDPMVIVKLAELGKVLGSQPKLEVQVHGFADPRGNAESNLELSLRRAEAVRQALIDGGAAPEQIQMAAHGEDLTTAPKGDLEAYAWERRVTLSLRPIAQGVVAKAE